MLTPHSTNVVNGVDHTKFTMHSHTWVQLHHSILQCGIHGITILEPIQGVTM